MSEKRQVFFAPPGRARVAYHHDPECSLVKGNAIIEPRTLQEAQNKQLKPCESCVKGKTVQRGYNGENCPLCGDHVQSVGHHLKGSQCQVKNNDW